jgi:hypothetical protein
MEIIWILLGVFTYVGVPLLLVVLVVGVFIYLFKGREKGAELDPKVLLRIYLYLVLFITLPLAAIGGALTTSVALSSVFGLQFSYNLQPVYAEPIPAGSETGKPDYEQCYGVDKVEVNGKKYCFDTDQPKKDLVTGISLFATMSILFAVHRYGLSIVNKKDAPQTMHRMYQFLTLGIFGLISVIMIPVSIYQLANYLLFPIEDAAAYQAIVPGQSLGIVLFFTPIWLYKLIGMIRVKDSK